MTRDPVRSLRHLLTDADLQRIALHVQAASAPCCVGIYSPDCHTVLVALVVEREIATWIIAPANSETQAMETAQGMRFALQAGYKATLEAADALRRASSIN